MTSIVQIRRFTILTLFKSAKWPEKKFAESDSLPKEIRNNFNKKSLKNNAKQHCHQRQRMLICVKLCTLRTLLKKTNEFKLPDVRSRLWLCFFFPSKFKHYEAKLRKRPFNLFFIQSSKIKCSSKTPLLMF